MLRRNECDTISFRRVLGLSLITPNKMERIIWRDVPKKEPLNLMQTIVYAWNIHKEIAYTSRQQKLKFQNHKMLHASFHLAK